MLSATYTYSYNAYISFYIQGLMITIASNPVHARVVGIPDDLKYELSELMSFQVAGAEHSAAAGRGWNGRSTLFGFDKAQFPTGLTGLAVSHLKQQGHQIRLIRAPAPDPKGPLKPLVDDFGITAEYDYQYETVEQLVRHRQIIAQIATGGGKSRIASIARARLELPTLFLTTRSVLMHQMAKNFQAAINWQADNGATHLRGIEVGVIGDSIMKPRKTVTCAMVQTIAARLNHPDPAVAKRVRDFLAVFEFIIIEEAHESSSSGFYDALKACKNGHYRLALTATPFMREDEEANMRLMACSGPVAIRVTEKELIDKGILARPEFKIAPAPMPPEVRPGSNWQRAYTFGIVQNEERNKIVSFEAKRAARHGESVMILVQRKDHGKILKKMIEESEIKVKYIFGESDDAERSQALQDLASGRINVLIGSTILDVGVDVPAVGMIILAGGGKAEVAMRQRIGRGMRRKPKGRPNLAYVVDFADGRNKHLIKHSAQRRNILETTPGFAEGILARGQDFSFTRR